MEARRSRGAPGLTGSQPRGRWAPVRRRWRCRFPGRPALSGALAAPRQSKSDRGASPGRQQQRCRGRTACTWPASFRQLFHCHRVAAPRARPHFTTSWPVARQRAASCREDASQRWEPRVFSTLRSSRNRQRVRTRPSNRLDEQDHAPRDTLANWQRGYVRNCTLRPPPPTAHRDHHRQPINFLRGLSHRSRPHYKLPCNRRDLPYIGRDPIDPCDFRFCTLSWFRTSLGVRFDRWKG